MKGPLITEAINAKVPTVQSEDCGPFFFPMCEVNQGGISQLRSEILVLLHQIGNRNGFYSREGRISTAVRLPRRTTSQKFADGLWMGTQQPDGFRDYWPTRNNGPGSSYRA